MKLPLVRLVAALLLSGQLLPVGQPWLCEGECRQQLQEILNRPAIEVTVPAQSDVICTCVNCAFCVTMTNAVVAPGGVPEFSVKSFQLVPFRVPTFLTADPQPPSSPPPQA